MSFVSWQYICLLLVTGCLFRIAPKPKRMHVLLIASYVFYAAWSVPFLAVLVLTTSTDYFCAQRISTSSNVAYRKALMAVAIIINLAFLVCFKYLNFILASGQSMLNHFGCNIARLHLDLILPLGISFYTFEAISYLVDVYKGTKPAPTWVKYNFYIMFFPHLVAGPIVRFNKLFPQYGEGINLPSWPRVLNGLQFITLGYFYKLVIADGAALVSHDLFARSASLSVPEALMAAGAYSAEIWMDFQGYTQIARGTALLFNIELPMNFHYPGSATNIANFWQRWNITLSRWLFDYVYVPLGGARRRLSNRMRGAFLTMCLAGIWHGAGFNYVLLGIFFGVLVAGYHAYRQIVRSLPAKGEALRQNSFYHWLSIALTQYLILIAGMLFNPDLTTDSNILGKILPFGKFFLGTPASVASNFQITPQFVTTAMMLLVTLYAQPLVARAYARLYMPLPYWIKVQAVTVVVFLCIIFEAHQTDPSFMYAQF